MRPLLKEGIGSVNLPAGIALCKLIMRTSMPGVVEYLKISVDTSPRNDAVTSGSSQRLNLSKLLAVQVRGSTSS